MTLSADHPTITLAILLLWLASAYLLGLGIVAIARPGLATQFLGSFAQTRRANWVEALTRAAIGLSFIIAAPLFLFSYASAIFGWFLLATAIALLVFPKLHRRIAKQSVAAVAPHIRLLGIASIAAAIGLGFLLSRI